MARAKRKSILKMYNRGTGETLEVEVPFNINEPVSVLKQHVRDNLEKDLEVWRLEDIR